MMASMISPSCYLLPSKKINAVMRVTRVDLSAHKIPTTRRDVVEDLKLADSSVPLLGNNDTKAIDVSCSRTASKFTCELYAVLEAVTDRIEMHKNVCDQRDNWNALLLNNINMITLAAATMAGVASASGGDEGAATLALKLSSTLLFSAATGMLLVMNKLQPSQLAEEQRKATRCFTQLHTQIQHTLTLGNPTEEDVKASIQKVLAIDKAYPLPLLGVMLEKLPQKYEPAVWWPRPRTHSHSQNRLSKQGKTQINGWSEELEMELREVIQVVKAKDIEAYERLGSIALKMNKGMAIAGPLLTGIAAVGSAFAGNGSWAGTLAATAGSLAAVINGFEHGGQLGMVFEMYRNCGGFFQQMEDTVEATLQEKDLDKREHGEIFEMKMALQLGRSVSQLRELASKSASYRAEGIAVDEFASKLF